MIKPEILDCTLRDGSYVTNFQFSKRDVTHIVAGLAKAGIDLIEVGHGLGLGASSPKLGISYEGDFEYIRVAKEAAPDAKIGSFFIPGIGCEEDIVNAKKSGLDFIRIGTNVDEITKAEKYIKIANKNDLEIHLNLMKTYAVDLSTLSKNTKAAQDWPLRSIYVVDSAGCMLPDNVSSYVSLLIEETPFQVGFHGHNNLGLANANCISAVNAGAVLVDGTLLGMGRSAGNAQLEIIAWLLEKSGHDCSIDYIELFNIAEKWVAPLMPKSQGLQPLDVTIGMSRFHTAFMPKIKRALDKYDVDLKKLIVEVSKRDFINPSQELIEEVAKDLSRSLY